MRCRVWVAVTMAGMMAWFEGSAPAAPTPESAPAEGSPRARVLLLHRPGNRVDAATSATVTAAVMRAFDLAGADVFLPPPRAPRVRPGDPRWLERVSRYTIEREMHGFAVLTAQPEDVTPGGRAALEIWNRRGQVLQLGTGGLFPIEVRSSEPRTTITRSVDRLLGDLDSRHAAMRQHLIDANRRSRAADTRDAPREGEDAPDVALLVERRLASLDRALGLMDAAEAAKWRPRIEEARRQRRLGQPYLALVTFERVYAQTGARPPETLPEDSPTGAQLEAFETTLANMIGVGLDRARPAEASRLLATHRAVLERLEAGHSDEALQLMKPAWSEALKLVEEHRKARGASGS